MKRKTKGKWCGIFPFFFFSIFQTKIYPSDEKVKFDTIALLCDFNGSCSRNWTLVNLQSFFFLLFICCFPLFEQNWDRFDT